MKFCAFIFAAILFLHSSLVFSQVRWTRDDLFLDPSSIPVDGVSSFAIADMDGDGALDFVLALDSVLVLYQQTPKVLPRFRKVPDYFNNIEMPIKSYDPQRSGIALYDFDGDGAMNPITYRNGKFIYWRNAGNRQVPQWRADSLFFPELDANDLRRLESLVKPSCGDLDGDGDADLMIGAGAAGLGAYDIIFFENVGTNMQPKWKRNDMVAQKFRGGYTWGMPRMTDVDNDGKPEVAIRRVVESSVSLHMLAYPSIQQFDNINMPLSLRDAEFADLDGDGIKEMIALLPAAGWRIYDKLGKNTSRFVEHRFYHLGVFRSSVFALPFVYDVDHDGKAEFTLMNRTYDFVHDDHCFVEHYRRTEFAAMPIWQDSGWLQQRIFLYLYCRIGIADLTGNKKYMLVGSVGYPTDWRFWFYTYRDTSRSLAFQWQADDSLFTFFKKDFTYKSPAFADFDRDQDSDLLIVHGNRLEFFENRYQNNREKWVRRDDWLAGIEISAEHASFGDIDHDGDWDAAFGTANGKVYLFDNVGSPQSPRWRRNSSLDQLQFQAHTAPALGDFDGDGDADLLLGWAEGDSSIYIGYQYGKLAYFRNDFVVSVGESSLPAIPTQFELLPSYPNPFVPGSGQPTMRLKFSLPDAARVRLSVYNLLGQRLRVLLDEMQVAGIHELAWDGRTASGRIVAPGVYLLQLESGENIVTKKLLILR